VQWCRLLVPSKAVACAVMVASWYATRPGSWCAWYRIMVAKFLDRMWGPSVAPDRPRGLLHSTGRGSGGCAELVDWTSCVVGNCRPAGGRETDP
jgi:hypothetical protein